jgi:hypothetical protein
MTTRTTAIGSCTLLMIGAWAGCSASDGGTRAAATQEPGAECAPAQLTQACTCQGGARGRQVCVAGAWSGCDCAAASGGAGSSGVGSSGGGAGAGGLSFAGGDPAANHSDVRLDWQRTEATGGSCEAGHYEGTFTGIYGPSIIVVADLKVIPVFPVELPGNPGLAFDLSREGSGEIFTVSNGKMNGNALGAFPISADIEGKLDCATRKFDAKLVNGSYFIGPIEYRFEGPIVADYDKLTHTLVNGTWEVEEPDYPGAGGSGDWTVQWIHN